MQKLPDSLAALNFWNSDGAFAGLREEGNCPPMQPPQVILESPQAGDTATYKILLTLPEGGIPKLGGVAFSFPIGFNLGLISRIDYSDDYEGEDLQIRHAYVYHNNIALFFKWGKSPPAGTVVTFTISFIGNPKKAGTYQISALLFSRWFRLAAGPALSEPFEIMAGSLVSLTVLPSEDLILRAGQIQTFVAEGRDRFGNVVVTPAVQWSLAPGSDEIGDLTENIFLATHPGTGRVKAEAAGLQATSGLITVLPGDIDHILMTGYPASIPSGESFPGNIAVTIFDRFDNLKFDYTGEIYFASSDANAILPFNESNPYKFVRADSGSHLFPGHLFALGTIGDQTITVTDGAHYTTSEAIDVTAAAIAGFKISLHYAEPLRAGEPLEMRAFDVVDKSGNPASGKIDISLLSDGTSPDGHEPILNDVIVTAGSGAAGQYLFKTGEMIIRATADTITKDFSLVVHPAAAADLELQIEAGQFSALPLRAPATISVFDLYGNLKTDFNAAVTPIYLSVDRGEINKTALNDSADFAGGIADLANIGIQFQGDPGPITLTVASTAGLIDNKEFFINGIDFSPRAAIPDEIFPNQKVWLFIQAQNPGNLTPLEPVRFEAAFRSCGNDCRTLFALPSLIPGGEENFGTFLSTDRLLPGSLDTIATVMISRYILNGDTIDVHFRRDYPVRVLDPLELVYLPGFLAPDTLLSPSELPRLSCRIRANQTLPESTLINTIFRLDTGGGNWITIPAAGNSSPRIDDRTFELYGLNHLIPDFGLLQKAEPERFPLQLICLATDRKTFEFVDTLTGIDTIKIAPRAHLYYAVGSLAPRTVAPGSLTSFAFDIINSGATTIALDRDNTLLTLQHDNGLIAAPLRAPVTIVPGRNHLTTDEASIPEELIGRELIPRFHMRGLEVYAERGDSIDFGGERITVSAMPRIRIMSTELITINPPNVNYGQGYSIKVRVQNFSEQVISDIRVLILSENGYDTLATSQIKTLAPYSGGDALVAMTAGNVSRAGLIYKADVAAAGVAVLPPEDNTVSINVQAPARLELTAELIGVFEGYVYYGQPFAVRVQLRNWGEAGIDTGLATLSTNGADFGIPDPSSKPIYINREVDWNLTAPLLSINRIFRVTLSEIPRDRNTGLSAQVAVGAIDLTIGVVSSEAELVVDGMMNQAPLVIAGSTRELFRLSLTNFSGGPLNIIGLKTIDVRLTDRRGGLLAPNRIVLPEECGFYLGEIRISSARVVNNLLRVEFAELNLAPMEKIDIGFRARFQSTFDLEGFSLVIENNDIRAVFVSGPRIYQQVPVRGAYDNTFRIGGNFIITPGTLAQSLLVRNNPFNPELEKAEFAYNLASETSVSMSIYTLTGEKVYETSFPAGQDGGRVGSNYVFWDGRNGEGKAVLNGVYVVIFSDEGGGQTYKMKVAVMK